MQRYRQTVDELCLSLSPIPVSWKDGHAQDVLDLLSTLGEMKVLTTENLDEMLRSDFDATLTLVRLCLELPKDEFTILLRARLQDTSPTVTTFRTQSETFLKALVDLGVTEAFHTLAETQFTWCDIVEERLKGGRGSAIKGQVRGRFLEDFVEGAVVSVFGSGKYDARCTFVGVQKKTGKADFAIPTRRDPRILIEVKAYGATGSKQTDVLGDVNSIVSAKRHDTPLLLVTDGITWGQRLSDLGKLVGMQNDGRIARIYTQSMKDALIADLTQLKQEHSL